MNEFQQAIFNKMYEIAGRFPENLQQRYFNAVQTFRLPYWDPWMPRNEANHTRNWAGLFGLPAILKAQEVFVRRPKRPDVLEGIENPLYRYKVPSNADLPKDAQIPWQSLKSGVRKSTILIDDLTNGSGVSCSSQSDDHSIA